MREPIRFDEAIGASFLRYARLVAGRGYVHNTLGRVELHPDDAAADAEKATALWELVERLV